MTGTIPQPADRRGEPRASRAPHGGRTHGDRTPAAGRPRRRPGSSRRRDRPRRAGAPAAPTALAALGVAATLLVAPAALPEASAGFTDSTFGAAELVTTSGMHSPPVDYDQSAASALFISKRGDLFVSGARGNGNGNGGTSPAAADPDRVTLPDGVRVVDAAGSTNDFSVASPGTDSFMALDDRGGVWTWGAVYPGGRAGRDLIGRGALDLDRSRAAGRVTTTADGAPLPPIARIARIENQFLALDRDGALWAWGYGGENLPNPAGFANAPLPVAANLTTREPSAARCDRSGPNDLGAVAWRSVWGGNNAASAVGQNGLVYSWGFDAMLPPAAGVDRSSALCPALDERANRALFQAYPELYRTPDGETYDERALPDERARHARYEAIADAVRTRVLPGCEGVAAAGKVDDSACPVRQIGRPARATLLLTQQGELFSWKTSAADYGDPFLGRSDRPFDPLPVSIGGSAASIERFSTGIGSVVAIDREGRAHGWGWNNYCQATGASTNGVACEAPRDSPRAGADLVVGPTPIAGIPESERVVAVATTQCAAWATTASGALYAWGAGTVAGSDFRTCRQPPAAAAGYKIYAYEAVDAAHPFGTPVTARATPTVKVTG